ncbi:restriction endonuclease [Deinococcus sp.]|uniref:restriction endonuclease n=1 Tax=Deinococcus sp. TaxID=47478 RepID=UPI003C7BDF88
MLSSIWIALSGRCITRNVCIPVSATSHPWNSPPAIIQPRSDLLAGPALRVHSRYKLSSRITEKTVREFRGSIPNGAQGAFITTSDFQAKAHDTATQAGFPRIGLVNGRQLVDLLTEHWEAIPDEVREKLGLRSGLVLA